jgi:ribosomal protein S18 acetylase RimI-like enzyme
MQIQIAQKKQLTDLLQIEAEISKITPWSKSFFTESIENQRTLVAIKDDQVIGYLIYQLMWGSVIFLSLLRVPKAHQRQGVGKKLLAYFIQKIKKEGCKRILSSTDVTNNMGNSFHQKYGFQKIGKMNFKDFEEVFYRLDLDD